MSRFNYGGQEDSSLFDGSLDTFLNSVKAANLVPNFPVKTNSTKVLVSEKLQLSDIDENLLTNPYNDVLEVVGTDNSIIMFKNQSTNPNPPEQGKIKLFSKTDNNLYMINPLGNEVQITKDANTFKDIWTFTTSSVGTGEFSITATEIIYIKATMMVQIEN